MAAGSRPINTAKIQADVKAVSQGRLFGIGRLNIRGCRSGGHRCSATPGSTATRWRTGWPRRAVRHRAGLYKVATNLISFPTPSIFNLIPFPRPSYSGGSGGSPPGNFFENRLLNRAFFSVLAEGWVGGRPKQKGKKISGEGGKAKTEWRENQVGKKGK